MMLPLVSIFLCLFSFGVSGPIPIEDSGFVTINKEYQSNMFWWLYGAHVADRTKVPLVVWLQGGPGGASEFGDFLEIGPLDTNLKPRNTTWLRKANLLFLDNPVGTGFSYTQDNRGFCTTDKEIGEQLVFVLKQFLTEYPIFQQTPFWIFSESYGGKMAANFGVELHRALLKKEITVNFQGVALGDSWIDPVGCMYSYPPFLQSISLIDEKQARNLTYYAELADVAQSSGFGENATYWWGVQQNFLEEFASDVNIYNYLHYTDYLPEDQLSDLMDGPIREKLKIPDNVIWGGQANAVFQYMSGDFMRSAVPEVDLLLAEGYQVAVFSGQLDIIVDVVCIDNWIKKLQWPGLYNFLNAPRLSYTINQTPNGYSKTYENLSLWNILNAGHMCPYDNGPMAFLMFEKIIASGNKVHRF